MPQFEYYNDPNSTVETNHPTRTISGNTVTYTGWEAVNLSKGTLPDVALFVPWAWPRIDKPDGSVDHYVAMSWDNDRGGWFNPNFDGKGYSLLVTVQIL